MAVKSQVFSVYFCWEPTEGHSRFFFVCHSPQIMVMRLLKSGNWHNWHEKMNIVKGACLKAAHWNQKARGMKQGGKRLKGNGPGLTCVQLLCVCVCAHVLVCIASSLKISALKTESSWASVEENAHLEAYGCKFGAREKLESVTIPFLVCNIQRTDLL